MRPLILVVDDDPLIRTLVELSLTRSGCQVCAAADGDGALEVLRSLSPSLILLDLQMPGLSGLAVLEAIKRNRRLRSTPVMMLTGSAEADDVRAAGESGAAGYMLKPFRPHALAARVGQLVRGGGAVWSDPSDAPATSRIVEL